VAATSAPVADVDSDEELAGEWVQTDIFALLAGPDPSTTPVETVESKPD
jgi:hypothetical protein